MKKDIIIPKVENVAIAIVKEEQVIGDPEWFVYLVNMMNKPMTNALVASKGYGHVAETGQKVKTSSLRHFYKEIEPKSFVKIEPIMPDVFGLNNEFWLSFFKDDLMHDKKYIFMAESVMEDNFVSVPLIEKPGVMIK